MTTLEIIDLQTIVNDKAIYMQTDYLLWFSEDFSPEANPEIFFMGSKIFKEPIEPPLGTPMLSSIFWFINARTFCLTTKSRLLAFFYIFLKKHLTFKKDMDTN